MAKVQLENVTKIFDDRVRAVDAMTLDVPDGQFMVIVGPSGCGKTTTLRLIAGLEEATTGKISIANTVVNDIPPNKRDVAMVFQNNRSEIPQNYLASSLCSTENQKHSPEVSNRELPSAERLCKNQKSFCSMNPLVILMPECV
jgi:ABC-type proline/glycine betaine transport system ATPase subunit